MGIMKSEQFVNKTAYVTGNIGIDTTPIAVKSQRTLTEQSKGHLRLACAVLYEALRMHLKYLKHYEVNPDCTCVACKQSHDPVEFLISAFKSINKMYQLADKLSFIYSDA